MIVKQYYNIIQDCNYLNLIDYNHRITINKYTFVILKKYLIYLCFSFIFLMN